MKSIKKLRNAFNNHMLKEKSSSPVVIEPTEANDASDGAKGLRDLRQQYEGLLSVSSVVAGRASDFSVAVQEMASYLLETFGSVDDGEMSKIFKILGRVQFEISKMLDLYAIQVAETITEPTESLLSELKNVEDSKKQHDEKRQLYDQLRMRIVKGRPKNGKAEAFADQQLEVVKTEFDKLSMFVCTRLLSLEQGRARSLITQAARHHTAQMLLFSRGHASLQAVEPYMRQVARERNIDRQLNSMISGHNDADYESDLLAEDDDDVSYIDDGEGSSESEASVHSTRWEPQDGSPERSQNENGEKEVPKNLSKEWNSLLVKLGRTSGENPHISGRASGEIPLHSSQSSGEIPCPSGKSCNTLQDVQQDSSATSFFKSEHTTEDVTVQEADISATLREGSASLSANGPPDLNGSSSESGVGDVAVQQILPNGDCDSIETQNFSSVKSLSIQNLGEKFEPVMPPTNMEKPPMVSFPAPTLTSTPVGFTSNTIDSRRKEMKRYSQSGPLTFSGMPFSSQPSLGNRGPVPPISNAADVHKSGPLGRSPLGRPFGSPKISPCLSPPRMSPPRISELHKLPPPPLQPTISMPHSAPLSRPREFTQTNSMNGTPLPPPPLDAVPRSLSLPTKRRPQRSKEPNIPQYAELSEDRNSGTSTRKASSSSQQVSQVQSKSGSIVAAPPARSSSDEMSKLSSNLKFVHYEGGWHGSARQNPSKQGNKPIPSFPIITQEKHQQSEPSAQAEGGSHGTGSRKAPNWRSLSISGSLSISDKDTYFHNLTGGSVHKRGFSHEIVSLSSSNASATGVNG